MVVGLLLILIKKENNMINKKMITVKLNNSRFSAYDNLRFELKELKREILNQLKEKKVRKNNEL